MINYVSIIQNTRLLSQTALTKRHGSAENYFATDVFYPGLTPDQKSKKEGPPWHEYIYDNYYDNVICSEYKTLHYATTNRNG